MNLKASYQNLLFPVSVDGGWSSWSNWDHCDGDPCTAGSDFYRTRNCSAPAPVYRGAACVGDSIEEIQGYGETCHFTNLI